MTKYAARSIVLERGGASVNGPYVEIGQVSAIGKVGSSRELIDASAYGDDWKDYVLGQQDGAEVTITIQLDPTDTVQDDLKDDYDDATRTYFQLSHADADWQATFPAIVTQFMSGGDRDGILEIELTLKIVNPGVSISDVS